MEGEGRLSNRLRDRVALITGAGAGMGRSHALVMAGRGAKLVVQDIDGRGAEETAALVREGGGEALVAVGDVADSVSAGRAVAAAESRFGRVDILVNNAGIASFKHTEEVEEAEFDRIFAVHVKGAFFFAQRVVPGMKARRMGKIINISSRWGQVGAEIASDYCGAKAALLGMTKAWAKELAPHNIHVNAVAPGGVWTPMAHEEKGGTEGIRAAEKAVPLGRWAQPEEISYAVAFLASSESDFITGQVIAPNGGATIVGF